MGDDLQEPALATPRKDRSAAVLTGAAGLLVGALMMNLVSAPGVEVVGVRQADGSPGGLSDDVAFDASTLDGEDGADSESSSSGRSSGATGSSGATSPGGDSSSVGTTPGGGGTGGGGGNSGNSGGSGASIRGVTDDSVKIGFTFFNVGIYGVVPQYDVGPGPEKMQAVIDRWKREGRDVVHGRKIDLVYTEFSITDEATQRAACLALVDDHKVFAVAAPAGVYAGTECITKEKKTPLVQTASTGGTADAVRTQAPYFFMVAPDRSQTSRNWAHWAHQRGLLEGKTMGFYLSEEEAQEVEENFIAELEHLGYGDQIEVILTAGDDDEVGPEDTVAVNQFRTNGVDLAVLLLNGLRMENFMNQAESQAYRPTYIASDMGVNTDDTKTKTFPPGQWEGTYAMTSMNYGQFGATLSGEAKICMEDYQRQGRNPTYGSAEFNYALMACHSLELVWQALDHAGPDLSVPRYIAGMEAIQGYAGAFNPATNFSASDHTGSDSQRTLQWSTSCQCWQPVTPFQPFYVP